MTTLFITVGIPGCGKSTYAEQWTDLEILASDDFREDLTGDVNDQTLNRAVFYVMNACTRRLLRNGVDVLIDATNLRPEYREDLMRIAVETGATPVAIRFEESENFDLCQDRNLNRVRIVPEDIMRRFHSLFVQCCSEKQMDEEGWKVIYPTVTGERDAARCSGGDIAPTEKDTDKQHT